MRTSGSFTVSALEHLRYRRYLDAHVDHELTGDLATRVAHHVAECPMCSRNAEITVDVKHSLARRRRWSERAAERVRRWAHHDLR